MPILILALIAVAILVVVGRRGGALRIDPSTWPVVLALAAAAGAVVVGLRGLWIPSLILIAISVYFGAAANRRRDPRRPERSTQMRLDDAREILGVSMGADRAEIEAAYRRLILRAHPDHGGSSGLAAQLNAARDLLLKKA